MSDEKLLDVLSELNEGGQPYLGTCTLVTGDGTVKVDFNNGRARVNERVARLVANHPHVTVPGLTDEDEPVGEPVGEEADDELEDEGETEEPRERRQATPEEIEAAKEHLAEEGLEVPEVEVTDADQSPPVREDFEATTGDGSARCQAEKADGSQCANPASNGSACGLPKHKEQLAG